MTTIDCMASGIVVSVRERPPGIAVYGAPDSRRSKTGISLARLVMDEL